MEKSLIELHTALLPKYLGQNEKITNIRARPLTTAGENYGSVLLDVEIEISTGNAIKTIQCVAKTVPKNSFVKEFFSSQSTFRKELGFYASIVPTLKEFANKQGAKNGIDWVAEFYGGRLSLKGNNQEFDENAVIFMENLKLKGYETNSRKVGFDFETAKLILKNLAALHALPIALKLSKPEEFETKIKPHLDYVALFDNFTEDMKKKVLEDIINILKENPKMHKYIERVMQKCTDVAKLEPHFKNPREPFATVTHNDFWVNNVLIKRNEMGKAEKIKIIDFQFTNYGSLAKDILFFIFDSVQNEVVIDHFDDLLKTYHEVFLNTLQEVKVNTTPFTMEKFLEEIEYSVNNTIVIMQCLTMLRPIFAEKDGVNDVENLTAQNIIKFCKPSKEHREKLYMVVEQFAKRNWL